MSSAPRLVDQLAGLTAIRDLELLEFSLLKTLNEFLQPQGLSLLKLDSKGRPRMEITFGQSNCAVKVDDIKVPDELRAVFEHLSNSNAREHCLKIDNRLLTIHALQITRAAHTYLLISTRESLTRLNSHLVTGMLQVYRNFCALLQDAQTDQLTGLANRKTFDECISKVYELIVPENDAVEIERRVDQPLGYWIAMVDIDHFKSVNDRFGHLYGDEVLVLLAQILKSVFRGDDMIFRFGGEEFVVIIRCADQASSRLTLERLRRTVEAHSFPQVGQVTISIGATRMVREVFAMTLLDYADQALYHSKKNGRNQVTFFEDMVASGIAKKEEIAVASIDYF